MGFFSTSLSSIRLWLDRFLEHPKTCKAKRHNAVGKDSDKTSYIERFNNIATAKAIRTDFVGAGSPEFIPRTNNLQKPAPPH